MKPFLAILLYWPLLTLAAVVTNPYEGSAQTIWKASWDVHPDTNCAGYDLIMWATNASGFYNVTNSVEGRLNNTAVLTNVPLGVVGLVMAAYDEDGVQGYLSSPPVVFTNRLAAPKGLKLTATIQASVTAAGPWRNLAKVSVEPVERQFFRTEIALEELP